MSKSKDKRKRRYERRTQRLARGLIREPALQELAHRQAMNERRRNGVQAYLLTWADGSLPGRWNGKPDRNAVAEILQRRKEGWN